MGTAFYVPIVETAALERDLLRLKSEFDFELCATVLDSRAESLESAAFSSRMGLLFGNEKHGLDSKWTNLCQRKVTIPMAVGADSLNVAVAAGIFFHHIQRVLASTITPKE
jgi:tRNA G18 (ribose-2'-O)-methylase SpoU